MLAAISAAAAFTVSAHAEWLTARHDAQRTGASDRPSNIAKPAQYWRAYLGGAIGPLSILIGDTDADGQLDVLYAAGGRLILKHPDGGAIWQTPDLDIVSVVDAADLDGDGAAEVVAVSGSQAFVINGRTGAVAWQEDPQELGTFAGVRIADFDGDGRLDLFVDACGACCAVSTGSPGVVYSFPRGFASPAVLGTPPKHDHCGAAGDTVGDWDGDGTPDLLVPSIQTMLMTRGSGAVLGESATIGGFIGNARCEAAPLDDVPGDEAVCIHNVIIGDKGARQVFALTYRPADPQRVVMLWQATLAPAAEGDLRAPTRLLWDLDGDGRLEVVASGKSGETWTTFVLDARTGATLGKLPDEIAQAALPPEHGAAPWLVTSHADRVSGWSFRRDPPPGQQGLELGWQLADRQVPTQQDRPHGRLSHLNAAPVLVDLDGDGRSELVLQSTTEPASLHAYRLDGGKPIDVAQYGLDAGVGVATLSVPTGVKTTTRLGVSRNDGYLALLDSAFATQNAGKEGNETLPGMRAGAYYTGSGGLFTFGREPLAAALRPDDKTESVFAVDARGDLVRIDAREASNASPARPVWRAQDAFGASIATNAEGDAVQIGCFRRRHPLTDPPAYVLAGLSMDGKQVAQTPLGRPPVWDVLPGDLDGDGNPDFAAMTADATLSTQVLAVNAAGKLMWQRTIAASYGTSPAALADWDGDRADDVVVAINTARVHSGRDGSILADSGGFLAYFMPLLADVNGDRTLEATMQGGLYPTRTLSHDLATPLWQGPDDRPYPYGALASCAGAKKLVEGSLSSPARLTITDVSGRVSGQRATVVLAGGQAFKSEDEAKAAKARLGQLGDVAVSEHLRGGNEGPAALVGSTDGFLYAIDACTGALLWSQGFDAAVGAPILADTDGDGLDDIVVSVADGYLYGLRQELLPAPKHVWDIDPPHGVVERDVDEISTHDTLYATWSPVEGATSYEVAVVGAAGAYVTSPAWIDVGNVIQAAIKHLPLNDGAKYLVGVRAVSSKGKGPDRPSNGVIVHLAKGPDNAGDGSPDVPLYGRGCACDTARSGREALPGLAAAGVALLVLAGRRQRRRPRVRA